MVGPKHCAISFFKLLSRFNPAHLLFVKKITKHYSPIPQKPLFNSFSVKHLFSPGRVMAGMLPGVEAARRRRCHQKSTLFYGSELSSTTSGCSTRRSSFCLYASSHEFHLSTSNSSMRSVLYDESRLGAEAREAKKRLDERLQAQITRSSSKGEQRWRRSLQERLTSQVSIMQAAVVPKMKKSSSSKRLRWLKLSWKSSEQEECAVCLEELTAETLMQLPCGHRFHKNCLLPWLEANGHCPCCRMQIQAKSCT